MQFRQFESDQATPGKSQRKHRENGMIYTILLYPGSPKNVERMSIIRAANAFGVKNMVL